MKLEDVLGTVLAVEIYAVCLGIVMLFQLALAAGLPWGYLSMGGKFPARYPLHMRLACLGMIGLLSLWGLIVFIRAGLILPEWYAVSRRGIWLVVALHALGVVMNLCTPSKWERILWTPVTTVLLICSSLVALA